MLLIFWLSGHWLIPAFQAVDFLMRSRTLSRFRPVGHSSRNIIKLLSLDELLINARLKIFAARFGLVFRAVILLTSTTGMYFTALPFAAFIGVFSL
ncbi:MAG: DUF4395 family protein [Draconibacterium sp.]|nr:DUF4395 family protein [Draconibacterium sp.]